MPKAQTCSSEFALCLEDVRFRWAHAPEDTLRIDLFAMQRGERVFISGPSGCGKSTLLALVAGILLPNSGSVTVNGVALPSMGSAMRDLFRGDHIGFIFQQFNLIPYLSLLENVCIPCHFSKIRSKKALKSAGSIEKAACVLLERLDLAPSLWKKQVRKLSIGQQQRAACARALIGKPELIIADEPTSALDADHREAFLRLLLEECSLLDTTLLFVSHDISLASVFPRVVHMADINTAPQSNESS